MGVSIMLKTDVQLNEQVKTLFNSGLSYSEIAVVLNFLKKAYFTRNAIAGRCMRMEIFRSKNIPLENARDYFINVVSDNDALDETIIDFVVNYVNNPRTETVKSRAEELLSVVRAKLPQKTKSPKIKDIENDINRKPSVVAEVDNAVSTISNVIELKPQGKTFLDKEKQSITDFSFIPTNPKLLGHVSSLKKFHEKNETNTVGKGFYFGNKTAKNSNAFELSVTDISVLRVLNGEDVPGFGWGAYVTPVATWLKECGYVAGTYYITQKGKDYLAELDAKNNQISRFVKPKYKYSEDLFRPAKTGNSKAKVLTDLQHKDCRWPLGKNEHDEFIFCGEKRVAGSKFHFCEKHLKLAVNSNYKKLEDLTEEEIIQRQIERKRAAKSKQLKRETESKIKRFQENADYE